MGGGIYGRFIPWELAVSKAPPHAKPIFTCESHKDEVGRSDFWNSLEINLNPLRYCILSYTPVN